MKTILAFQMKIPAFSIKKRFVVLMYIYFSFFRVLEALIMYVIVKLDFVLIRTNCFGKQL